MKHLVLVFILVLFSGYYCNGQKLGAREIVNRALKVHTGGKVLSQYAVNITYDKPGKVNPGLVQKNPWLSLIDSLMLTMSDSMRREMEIQKAETEKSMYSFFNELHEGQKETYYFDIKSKIAATVILRPNRLKGRPDTSRTVYALDPNANAFYHLKNNPVAILQLMAMDTSELNYTGAVTFEGRDYHVVQVRVGVKWLDVYFDGQSNLLSKLFIMQVDTDPLIGRGPVYYKDIIYYKQFEKKEGFWVPNEIEEVDSQNEFTIRKKMEWVSINKPFAPSTFAAEPSEYDRVKYNISEIGKDLYVLEVSRKVLNERSLLKVTETEGISLFATLSNIDLSNEKYLSALKEKFPDTQVRNIFNLDRLSGVLSLSAFFSGKTHCYAPIGTGFFAEEKIRAYESPREDSTRQVLRKEGLFTTFDADFKTADVETLILNPVRKDEFESIWVAYYLPKDRAIFINGTPFHAGSSSGEASKLDKMLYELASKRSLSIEKIIYSGSYLDNAPLFMSYEKFEKRVKNTDFSKYDRKNK